MLNDLQRRNDNMEEDTKKFEKIRNLTKDVFDGTTANYKQKLVYNLLNAAKTDNQKEFFWMFFRALNARKDEKVEKLSEELGKYYPVNISNFEKIAYSIILGIMAAKSEGGEK